MDKETVQILKQKIQLRKSEEKWLKQDKEIIAGYYIRLYELIPDQFSPEEREEAGKYCKAACFAALFGTSSLEHIPIYSRYAQTIDPDSNDIFLQSSCLRAEAMAAILLGKEALPKLRLALHLLRNMQRTYNTIQTQNKIVEKTISTLNWLARQYQQLNYPERALKLCDLSISLLSKIKKQKKRKNPKPTQIEIKQQLIKAFLLEGNNKKQAAAALILKEIPPDTSRALCETAAEILHKCGLFSEAEPYLKQSLQKEFNSNQSTTLQCILLDRAIQKEDTEAIWNVYNQGVEILRHKRQNFTLPENMDAFLGESSSFYTKMLEYLIDQNDFNGAIQTIQDSYWPHPQAGDYSCNRNTRLKAEALNREKRKNTQSIPIGDIHKKQNYIVFHVDHDRIFRLSNINNSKNMSIIHWDSTAMQREIHGLLSLATSPASLPSLYKAAIYDFKKKLFNNIEEKLNNESKITITANAPLSRVPWPILSDTTRFIFRPGNSRAQTTQDHNDSHLLSIAEDGSTLPMAKSEQEFLRQIFPGSTHLNGNKNKKANLIQKLESCTLFHFAGHGYEHSKYPEKSGLVLKGSPPDIDSEDLISFDEIRSLNLEKIHLAFLNSCSSGTGKDFTGGIQISVASAFLDAGVQNLIVSCNPVLDHNSKKFTEVFYTIMQQNEMPIDEAFFKAHRSLPNESAPYIFIQP